MAKPLRVLLPALLLLLALPAQAGSVTGQALDETGRPLAGVHVEIVYQTYRADQLNSAGASIKAETLTDADGRYAVDLRALPPGEYAAHAYRIFDNGGRQMIIDLVADDPATFASTAATQRNFTAIWVESSAELPYGNGGIFVLGNAIGDSTDLGTAEVTLVNIESGFTLVRQVRPSGEGLVVTGVPFGTYRASVTLAGRPLRVGLWGDPVERFGASVTHDFTMGWLGNQFQVQALADAP